MNLPAPNATADPQRRFVASAFDALSAHIAILDASGVVVAVNQAWREFGAANGGQNSLGQNYLQVAENSRDHDALQLAAGIRQVLSKEVPFFEHEYPCHAPHQRRYFLARVTQFEQDKRTFIVVAHENITQRKLAELEVRALNAALRQRAEHSEGALQESRELMAEYAKVSHHDVQEPLRLIGLLSSLVSERYKETLGESGQQYLALLTHNAAALRSRIEALAQQADTQLSSAAAPPNTPKAKPIKQS